MLFKRGSHGCNRVTTNNTEYIIIFGGYDNIDIMASVHFLNLATRKWETYPNNIFLPQKIASVHGSIVMRLDTTGCEMMIISAYPTSKVFICKDNYQWTILDYTGKLVGGKMVTIGANELMPCGIIDN